VVVAYHGLASDTDTIEGKMKLVEYERSAVIKSILVYPESRSKGGGLLNPAAFNGAGCCKNAADFQDEEMFVAIVDSLVNEACVDPAKVNAMGFSNGGFMVHRLACSSQTSAKLTAGCSHSGLIGDYNGDLARSPWGVCEPRPVMGIHGTSDITVPFKGGKNPLSPARWWSFEDTMAIWTRQCDPAHEVTDGSKTIRTSKCGSHEVVSIIFQGYGHEWHPDSTDDCFTFFSVHGGI